MGQNAPYLCIAKRVTGHGVYSNCSQLLYTGHCTGRRFHAKSMKIPRQPARYGAAEGVFMPEARNSRGSLRDMGQNAPYLCIAKRVAGHGVNRNVPRETNSIRPGIRHGA